MSPNVIDLGATINLDVLADPNLPGRVYVTDLDWPLLVSSDDLVHVALNTPKDATATGANAGGLALDTSTTPSTVYVGTDGGRFKGEIWSNPDPGRSDLAAPRPVPRHRWKVSRRGGGGPPGGHQGDPGRRLGWGVAKTGNR